jgi:uncharacterized protein (TIGR00251 family)
MNILISLIGILAQLLVLLVIISVILSYFMDPYHPLRRALDSVVEPMLSPIRRIIPPIGMLDFSPLILIILIQLLSNIIIRILISLRWTMSDRKFNLHDGKKGSALAVRVTPRASRNEIVELLDDGTIKVRIAAPPSDNEANETLINFLSEVLGVPKSRLDIVAGMSGRDKLISIVDMDAETAHQRILAHVG